MNAHKTKYATTISEKQDDSEVVQVLKKKLSFIVNSLAKRGLITTDFIDLVEEDNVIELDEVKLCESLTIGGTNSNNSSNTNGHTNNNTNSNRAYSEEEYDVHNSSRSEMFDANGNALVDRRDEEEEEFIEYDGEEDNDEELDSEEHDEDNTTNNTNTSSVARPVPFIQFL